MIDCDLERRYRDDICYQNKQYCTIEFLHQYFRILITLLNTEYRYCDYDKSYCIINNDIKSIERSCAGKLMLIIRN